MGGEEGPNSHLTKPAEAAAALQKDGEDKKADDPNAFEENEDGHGGQKKEFVKSHGLTTAGKSWRAWWGMSA